jgi:hypothetical protein
MGDSIHMLKWKRIINNKAHFVFSHTHNFNYPGLAGLIRPAVLSVSLALAFADGASAQSISGNILSISGVPIPGVTVIATQTATLQHLTNVTDSLGHYVINVTVDFSSTYAVVPDKSGYVFSPTSTNLNFAAFSSQNYSVNFSTPASVPTAFVLGSQPALIIDPMTALLLGSSNPDGTNTTVYFQYGLTASYSGVSSNFFIGGGINTVAVSNLLSGLLPGANYHMQLIASNQFGMAFSGDNVFTMPAGIPAVSTLAASDITAGGATLNGTATPYALATSAWFQWGVTNSPYGSQTAPVLLNGTNTALAFSNNLTGLTPGVVYHYRAVATNAAGITNGSDVLFGSAPMVVLLGAASMTNECHTVFTDPGATNAASLQVTVTGSVDTNSPGDYLLTYTASNSLGGIGTATRTVTVVDTTPPVITVLGANPLYVVVNTPLVDPGATALDTCGGSFAVTSNSTVNLAVPGNYAITYFSTDNYNNTGTAMRTVVVRPRQIVTTVSDSGPGSLRQIISNSIAGDYIQFATNLSGATIYLTSGQLVWSNNFTIDASALPGGIFINGSQNGGIFRMHANTTNVLIGLMLVSGGGEATMFGGGAILNAGTLTVSNCTLIGNYAVTGYALGGGIYNDGTATINNSTLIDNFALGAGGGIYNYGTMTLNQSTLADNYGIDGAAGGGIYNDSNGILTVNQCTLSGNSADGVYPATNPTIGGDGGAILNVGWLTVNQSTFTGNHADISQVGGGAICSGSVLIVNQSTFIGNHANNITYSPMFATGGGGIYYFNSTISPAMTNNIIAGNSGADILANYYAVQITFGGANLVQTLGALYSGPDPLTNSPLLAPLGDYGGPTLTMPPLPGSPAVDAGSNTTFTTDQRGAGFPRVVGLATDIGAVEGIYNAAGPGQLTGITRLGNGSTQFAFTNYTDTSFTVLGSTDVSLPMIAWTCLGPAVESPVGSGYFQFIDPQATNFPQRFYRVHAP